MLRSLLCLILAAALALPAQATAFLSPAVKVHEPEDAFGSLVFQSGNAENAYRYCGEQYDADFGLYYLRARYLNPDSGRFWSMDDYEGNSGDPAALHKYLYGHGNPGSGSDPSGHSWLSELAIVQWAQNTLRIMVVPTAARLGTTALFNIYRGVMIAEKGVIFAEYVGVGVGVLGLAAEGADRIAQNLLNNSDPIGDGPYPEMFKRGGQVERSGKVNLGGNVSRIDDLDGNGVATSLRSHNLSGGEDAYLRAIQDDLRDVSEAREKGAYGTTNKGKYVEYSRKDIKGTALVVGIPEDDVRITLSPSFRSALKAYRDTYKSVIQVVPVRGWRK